MHFNLENEAGKQTILQQELDLKCNQAEDLM